MMVGYSAQEDPLLAVEMTGRRQSIDALEQLLAAGWRIDPPVLARLSWAQRHSGELAYHFILAHDTRRSLVVIADSPELHRFLAEHAIAVA